LAAGGERGVLRLLGTSRDELRGGDDIGRVLRCQSRRAGSRKR
jgi:hypothetical protein